MRTFNLADLFEIVTDTVPDRLAIVAGPEERTYRQLDERATRRLLLESCGVARG